MLSSSCASRQLAAAPRLDLLLIRGTSHNHTISSFKHIDRACWILHDYEAAYSTGVEVQLLN